jgi:hypothetical protein
MGATTKSGHQELRTNWPFGKEEPDIVMAIADEVHNFKEYGVP